MLFLVVRTQKPDDYVMICESENAIKIKLEKYLNKKLVDHKTLKEFCHLVTFRHRFPFPTHSERCCLI